MGGFVLVRTCPKCHQRQMYFQRRWHWRWKGKRVIATCGVCFYEADQAFVGEAEALDHWQNIPRRNESE